MESNELIYKRIPLSVRIFIIVILLVFSAIVSMAVITFYQYKNVAVDYNNKRLDRKEQVVIETFDYLLSSKNTLPEGVKERIGTNIYEIADINNVDINFYDLNGKLLLSNKGTNHVPQFIPKEILKNLSVNNDRIDALLPNDNYESNVSVYRYIYNNNHQPIAILNLPYFHDESFLKEDYSELLYRYLGVTFVLMIFSGIIAWILSRSLTRRIKNIAYRLNDTEVLSVNRPILYNYVDEISPLVNAYNQMVKKFDEQTRLMAKAERDDAWREMAKQVAHEIKNPLTPMKLEIQSFQMRFNPQDPGVTEKLAQLTKSITQQIDTISSIAEAFSSFAKMPIKDDKTIDIVENIKNVLEIFPKKYISFIHKDQTVFLKMDELYLNRIITNLLKNAFQAIPEDRIPQIIIKISQDLRIVYFSVSDNGNGILEEIQSKIFSPQFTTKNSGSGLGLAITKKIIEEYNGSIEFESTEGKGTTFKFEIPKNA